jgi:hypothetical protein
VLEKYIPRYVFRFFCHILSHPYGCRDVEFITPCRHDKEKKVNEFVVVITYFKRNLFILKDLVQTDELPN